jgi:hypothetical protein
MHPIYRDLAVAGLVQFFALLLASTMLDQGEWMLATCRLSTAFWFGVIIILLRRHNSLTSGDHRYLTRGLLWLLLIGIPVTLVIWGVRGIT